MRWKQEEPAERVDLMRRASRVYDEKLADNEQAFAAALLAYEIDVSDEETVKLLERLAAIGAKVERAAANRYRVAQRGAGRPMAAHRPEHGQVVRRRVSSNHPEWAIPIYQEVLARDSDNLLALHSMTSLYRKTQQWPQLSQLLERCIAVARTEEDRRKMHVELGEVLEKQLGNVDGAVENYKAALNFNARDVAAPCRARAYVYEVRGGLERAGRHSRPKGRGAHRSRRDRGIQTEDRGGSRRSCRGRRKRDQLRGIGAFSTSRPAT